MLFSRLNEIGAILPLTPFEEARLSQILHDLNEEVAHQIELYDIRKAYLAVAAIDRFDEDLIALAALEQSRAQPSWPSYTEVSDEPECSGNNPLTMLNWRVEDGGGALGAC